MPEAKAAVLFERGHATEHAVVKEVRRAPFDRLFHVRTRGMHELPNVLQDGLREGGAFGDVSIDSGVF